MDGYVNDSNVKDGDEDEDGDEEDTESETPDDSISGDY